jgi:prohibitin 2
MEFVFNALAVVFFVMMFAGIALIVLGISRGQGMRGGLVLAIIGLILGIASLVVSEGVLVVGPTETAVVFNVLAREYEEPRGPGLHIIFPVMQQSYIYNTSRQEYTMSGDSGEGARSDADDAIQARSADGQEVLIDVTIIFSINPTNVNVVHQRWSQGYVDPLIRPVVRSVVRDVVAGVRAEDIYGVNTTANADGTTPEVNTLEAMQAEIETLVREALADDGFDVSDVLLREINFSEDFVQAIEERQVAELSRDRAAIEAETAQIEAEGLANARIAQARGEAEATLLQAEAEAQALSLVSEQIAANPNLIQYTYISELGDNVSLVIIPSNSPFLFDPTSFTEMGADFTAPENQAQETEEAQPETEGDAGGD